MNSAGNQDIRVQPLSSYVTSRNVSPLRPLFSHLRTGASGSSSILGPEHDGLCPDLDSGSPWPHPPFSHLQWSGKTMGSRKSAYLESTFCTSQSCSVSLGSLNSCTMATILPPEPVQIAFLGTLSKRRHIPHRVNPGPEVCPRDSHGQAVWMEFVHVS